MLILQKNIQKKMPDNLVSRITWPAKKNTIIINELLNLK